MTTEGTKYGVQYRSGSKGLVNIEDMATPHIINAWRKLVGWQTPPPENVAVVDAMLQELQARGCTYNAETARWDIPPKEGA